MGSEQDLKRKQDYYARVRRKNYRESLRLEGFDVSGIDPEAPLPDKQALIRKYRKEAP